MGDPFDPFDGTHTKGEVQEFLLHHYRGQAYRGFLWVQDYILSTNSDGRRRESEGAIEVSRLFLDNTERRYIENNPGLSAMDVFALDVALPWADVQSVTTCGGDSMSPVYCVGVTRLPTASSPAVAMTLGHFILLDITDNSRSIIRDDDGNYVPDRELLTHELTHMYRSSLVAHMDEDGMDDREWYFGYVYDSSWFGDEVEENCAYQVGQSVQFSADHVVVC